MINPKRLLIIGFVLVVLGVVLPFLMVLQIVPSTFFLNLIAFIASFLGIMLGIVGAMTYVAIHRNRER